MDPPFHYSVIGIRGCRFTECGGTNTHTRVSLRNRARARYLPEHACMRAVEQGERRWTLFRDQVFGVRWCRYTECGRTDIRIRVRIRTCTRTLPTHADSRALAGGELSWTLFHYQVVGRRR